MRCARYKAWSTGIIIDTHTLDVPTYLSVLPLFSDMERTELQRLALGCQLRRLARGETLFHVGQPCAEFHVVVVGQVKLFVLSPGGQEKVVELIGPGNSFAEALMFTDRPYILNSQALTETLLLTIEKQAVLTEIEHDSRFALRMLAGISRRLHGLVTDVESYALHSGIQRVIGYLMRDVEMELGDDTDEDTPPAPVTVALPVSKATIASRLSLTPEYFSRVLRELESAGLIEVDKRNVRIVDARRLAEYHPMV